MFLPIVRLVVAGILFLASLMVVVPAQRIWQWYVVIVATELGPWLAVLSAAILLWELLVSPRPLHQPTVYLAAVSIALFLTPLVEAIGIAGHLPARLAAAWGEAGRPNSPSSPLRLMRLWILSSKLVAHEERREFTTRDDVSLPLLIYADETPGLRPCILVIHGGGWNTGRPDQLPEISREFARLGYRVASMGYRLAPRYHWPAQREDVAAALAYLKQHAGELKIDPAQIILYGRSAGGQIALDSAYTLHDSAIRGCIASYPPTDMNFAYWTGGEHDILGSRTLVRGIMGGPPGGALNDLYRDASPLDFVDATTPPTLLIHGTRDEIVWVRHSERLQDKMRATGRPVFLLELPWATHGFDVVAHGPGGQLELYAMAWFLKAETR